MRILLSEPGHVPASVEQYEQVVAVRPNLAKMFKLQTDRASRRVFLTRDDVCKCW